MRSLSAKRVVALWSALVATLAAVIMVLNHSLSAGSAFIVCAYYAVALAAPTSVKSNRTMPLLRYLAFIVAAILMGVASGRWQMLAALLAIAVIIGPVFVMAQGRRKPASGASLRQR